MVQGYWYLQRSQKMRFYIYLFISYCTGTKRPLLSQNSVLFSFVNSNHLLGQTVESGNWLQEYLVN